MTTVPSERQLSPGGARDQVARLLRLVPFLHGRRGVRLADAADALGVSEELVLADLKVLLMCGLPGGYPDDLIDVDLDALETTEGDGVIRVSNADYLARPLRLTPTEATALLVALRALRAGADESTRDIVDRTVAKLEAAVDDGALASVEVGDVVEPAPDPRLERLRADLQDAATRRRQVRLTYYVPARDEATERVVDPRGLVTSRKIDYLDAWCHTAQAPRLFRLERIRSADVLDTPIETPAEDPRDLSTGLFKSATDATLVTLRLQPQASWAVEYYPVEAIRRLDGDELEVDLLVVDRRWLQRLLLRLSPYASVVGPPEVADTFEDAVRRTLRLYSGPDLGSPRTMGSNTDNPEDG
jgi:proteasome accessory factor C